MNRNQENNYAMGLALRDFLNQNATITSALPEFGTFFTSFSDNMDQIHVIREQLAHLFKANDALLRKIDLLMEIVRLTQPLFYAAYRNNRKVIDSGKNYLTLLATITDAVTKAGIKGVKVIFASQNGNLKMASSKSDKPIIKVTADKGKFRIKSLPAGTYNATINKPGYTEKVIPVTVADSETTELVVELEKM